METGKTEDFFFLTGEKSKVVLFDAGTHSIIDGGLKGYETALEYSPMFAL